MAEILVKAADAVNSDPELDRLSYKRGDPVVIRPDGHNWASGSLDLNVFYIIKIPGVDPEQLVKYLEPEYDTTANPDPESGDYPVKRRRRFWGQNTPLEWQEFLAANGYIEKTWEELRDFIWDKTDGSNLTGVPL